MLESSSCPDVDDSEIGNITVVPVDLHPFTSTTSEVSKSLMFAELVEIEYFL